MTKTMVPSTRSELPLRDEIALTMMPSAVNDYNEARMTRRTFSEADDRHERIVLQAYLYADVFIDKLINDAGVTDDT